MTPLFDSTPDPDSRWEYGMNGWRVLVTDPFWDAPQYGEVTGYDIKRQFFWVVVDDAPNEPRYIHWDYVRPA